MKRQYVGIIPFLLEAVSKPRRRGGQSRFPRKLGKLGQSPAVLKLLLIGFVAFGSSLLFGSPDALAAGTNSRPNIVFIFSDDHGYQAISAYNKR